MMRYFLLLLLTVFSCSDSTVLENQCLDLDQIDPASPVSILEAAGAPEIACTVLRSPEQIPQQVTTFFKVANSAQEGYAAWNSQEESIVWARLNSDGSVTDASTFAAAGQLQALAATTGRLLVGWQKTDGGAVVSAIEIATGAATDLSELSDGFIQEVIVLDAGYGVVMSTSRGSRFVQLARDGVILSDSDLDGAHNLHAAGFGNGVGLAFARDNDCYFARVDQDGGITETKLREAPANELGLCLPSDLVPLEDGFLVAINVRSEVCGPRDLGEFGDLPIRERHVELIAVDELGQAIWDAPRPLSGAAAHVRELNARFFDLADGIGLVWSRGSVIYMCGGCIGDDELKFTILSKGDLLPKTATTTLPSPIAAQLVPKVIIERADGLDFFFQFVVHAINFPGSAQLQCSPIQ